MARYLVSSEHTEEDCVRALDSVLGMSEQLMARFDWGCKDGEHRGWVVVEAQDKNTAKMLLPTFVRGGAHVVEITKFTPEDVKSFHEH